MTIIYILTGMAMVLGFFLVPMAVALPVSIWRNRQGYYDPFNPVIMWAVGSLTIGFIYASYYLGRLVWM